MTDNQSVVEVLVARAVELWCRELKSTRYINGEVNPLVEATALARIEISQSSIDDLDRRIEIFRGHLTSNLMNCYHRHLESPDFKRYGTYFYGELDTDYHPNKLMADAADLSGIPHKLFSVKSSVAIMNGYIECKFGYAQGYTYQYPLGDGRWLTTTLKGSKEDMDKILTSVVNGNPLDLTVDN